MPLERIGIVASPKYPVRGREAPKDHLDLVPETTPIRTRPMERLCRHCGMPLMTSPEWRLGIHIWCVYHIDQRAKLHSISRPRYGNR